MTYTVTLYRRLLLPETLETSSAKSALEFYSRPNPSWPVTAEIKRDGKVIGVDGLIRDAMHEDSEPAPL